MGKDKAPTPSYRSRVVWLHRAVYSHGLYALLNDAIEALRGRGCTERETMYHLHNTLTHAFHPATEVKPDAKD